MLDLSKFKSLPVTKLADITGGTEIPIPYPNPCGGSGGSSGSGGTIPISHGDEAGTPRGTVSGCVGPKSTIQIKF